MVVDQLPCKTSFVIKGRQRPLHGRSKSLDSSTLGGLGKTNLQIVDDDRFPTNKSMANEMFPLVRESKISTNSIL